MVNSPLLHRQHPLQRLRSPSRTLSALVHIAGLVDFIYCFRVLYDFPNETLRSAYGWPFDALTVIGLALATVTFALGLFADLTLSPLLFSFKNIVATVAAPLEVLVSLLYWSLYAIDKTLVNPPGIDPLPLLDDLSFHWTPAVVLFIDFMLLSPPWTLNLLTATAVAASLAIAYYKWLALLYSANGRYPYPLMELLDTQGMILLFAASALLMIASTMALKWIYGKLNGTVHSGALGNSKNKRS